MSIMVSEVCVCFCMLLVYPRVYLGENVAISISQLNSFYEQFYFTLLTLYLYLPGIIDFLLIVNVI